MTTKRAKAPAAAIRGREEDDHSMGTEAFIDWVSRLPVIAVPTRAQKIEVAARMALAAMDPKQRNHSMFKALREALSSQDDDVFADEPAPVGVPGMLLTSLDLEFPADPHRRRWIRTVHLPDTVHVKPGRAIVVKVSVGK